MFGEYRKTETPLAIRRIRALPSPILLLLRLPPSPPQDRQPTTNPAPLNDRQTIRPTTDQTTAVSTLASEDELFKMNDRNLNATGQQPTNISPIPSTSKQTVNKPSTASPAMSPSILCDAEFQPEVVQEEAAVSPDPIPTILCATPTRAAIREEHIVRSTATPSKSYFNETDTNDDETVTDFVDILKIVSPLPQQLITNKETRLKNKKHSEIITSTPMKAIFDEKKRKRTEKEKNTKKNKKTVIKKIAPKVNVTNGNLPKVESDDEDSSDDQIDECTICDDESEYSEDETLCAICLDTGKSGEMWYRFRSCGNWAHEECSGSDSPASYISTFCLDP
ncbi:unnamed protein product [Acanthoscelides obtectus]|uniref:Uncharacterized protein n=1 Tax=Acanthoscelides obtectus TaxID=200917 RepID=A0A9P0KCC4_ACAOB|nr:unnamed protein product [Acanthoscelides obtectus]CAK1657529.1 hypothetical protein AOBTE_LOCUS20397 [Acanthoscelides obtectus]